MVLVFNLLLSKQYEKQRERQSLTNREMQTDKHIEKRTAGTAAAVADT